MRILAQICAFYSAIGTAQRRAGGCGEVCPYAPNCCPVYALQPFPWQKRMSTWTAGRLTAAQHGAVTSSAT
jgi:hypothetical protein